MNKKILMVAYTNYVTDARPRREAETLASRGDDVTFIGLSEKTRPDQEQINGVNIIRVSFGRYRGDSGLRYVIHYLKFFIAASFLVARYYVKRRYDIVYVHTMPDFMVFVGLFPKILGAKIVLNIHDMMPELYMSKFSIGERHVLIRLLKVHEKISCWFADDVICVHHPHKDVLTSRGVPAEKITVLMNVPDPAIFQKGQKIAQKSKNIPTIVYHGTIAQRLGLDLAVDAFSIVLRTIPDARFEIYGDGDAAEQLEMKIRILNISNNVVFYRKFFNVEEIPSLVSGAALGIIPNRKDLATEYMLPVKLLEYVYLDIPVIASSLKTIRHYFSDDMVEFYQPGNVSELAAKMTLLLKDEQRRGQFAHNAGAFTRKYSWEIMKKDLFSLIDKSEGE
jgi:glycosyltransferase involved in cell wall biosynthesis